MIEINLLPEDLRKKPAVKLALPAIPAAKVLKIGAIVFIAAQVLLAGYALFQRIEVAKLHGDYAALQESSKEVIKIKDETEEMKNRMKDIRSLTERKFYWAKLLNALTDSMYKGVWLRNFSLAEGQESFLAQKKNSGKKSGDAKPTSGNSPLIRYLKLEGSVVGERGAEPAAIGKFITQLKTHPVFSEIFEEVELSNINQRHIKEVDVYDFVLICIFRSGKWELQ